MIAIEIKNLSKIFRGKRGAKVEALTDLSLELIKGEVFGFLGPNGAGKSTTIKILMGLISPTSGIAKLNGEDVRTVQARARVGYLPENPAFYEFLSAKEYLQFSGQAFGLKGKLLDGRIEEVLELLDLTAAKKRLIRGYSKGMVQRLGIAQTLLHDPDLFILDEPMSGLDPIGRALVKKIILKLKQRGKTVFFSTHITSDVETVCDKVGILKKGSLQCVKDVRDFLTAGISGYQVRLHKGSDGQVADIVITKEQLPGFLAENSQDIVLVEPVRKHLEELFLDIVMGVD